MSAKSPNITGVLSPIMDFNRHFIKGIKDLKDLNNPEIILKFKEAILFCTDREGIANIAEPFQKKMMTQVILDIAAIEKTLNKENAASLLNLLKLATQLGLQEDPRCRGDIITIYLSVINNNPEYKNPQHQYHRLYALDQLRKLDPTSIDRVIERDKSLTAQAMCIDKGPVEKIAGDMESRAEIFARLEPKLHSPKLHSVPHSLAIGSSTKDDDKINSNFLIDLMTSVDKFNKHPSPKAMENYIIDRFASSGSGVTDKEKQTAFLVRMEGALKVTCTKGSVQEAFMNQLTQAWHAKSELIQSAKTSLVKASVGASGRVQKIDAINRHLSGKDVAPGAG